MSSVEHRVTIKGNLEGLQFYMDDACSFEDLQAELERKLMISHAQILQGPLTHVHLYFGNRHVTPDQKETIVSLIQDSGNLIVKGIHADVISLQEAKEFIQSALMKVEVGMIRSGQVLESKQDILILGDVNPGGTVISDGNIFVMGIFRGIAHAGRSGDQDKIIAASRLQPTQLRIADVINSVPDEWDTEQSEMEFAFLKDERIYIEAIRHLKQIRPNMLDMDFFGE